MVMEWLCIGETKGYVIWFYFTEVLIDITVLYSRYGIYMQNNNTIRITKLDCENPTILFLDVYYFVFYSFFQQTKVRREINHLFQASFVYE